MLGIEATDEDALRVLKNGGADLRDLGGGFAGGVDDLGDSLAAYAAQVQGGELVEVADLAPSQSSCGFFRGDRASSDRSQ